MSLAEQVTVVEMLPTLVPNEDAELGIALGRYFEQEGIEIYTNARVGSVSYNEPEGYRLEVGMGDKRQRSQQTGC